VLKGQQVYGDKFGEQSSTEETILKILKKLPTPIAKAKFFMGLSIAGKNNKYNKMIERKLATTITSWRLVEDAVPPNGNKTYTIKTLFRLLESVEKSSLSRLIKSQIENHISNMLLNKEAIFPGKGFFSDIQPVTQEENQDEEENVSKSGFNRQTYQKGEYIFHEGHAGNEAYLIVSGEVEIFKETTTEKTTLGNLGRGALFGEMSIIDNEPRMAAAMAKEQTTLTIIPKESFKEKLDKLEEFDPVLRRMIDVFINRIRSNANSNK
jgi:CRP-like cAMP-binding protein